MIVAKGLYRHHVKGNSYQRASALRECRPISLGLRLESGRRETGVGIWC